MHTIGLLIFPDFQIADLAGPAAVFEAASYFAREQGGYRLKVLSAEGGMVKSSCGISTTSQTIARAGHIDTLIVIGGSGSRSKILPERVFRFITRSEVRCRRVCSVCTGAFLLARAGLLTGRKATTHWRHSASLQRNYPNIDVCADRIWVKDGKIWSSAGVSAGTDLALALVAEDYGADIARATAREIVVYYNRPGGQSQFSTIADLSDAHSRFHPLLGWLRENIDKPIKVEDMAAQMAMSSRNFSRRFHEELGMSPYDALIQMRLESARALLESSKLPLSKIARGCGFNDVEIMRRAFVKFIGRSPRALRREASSLPQLIEKAVGDCSIKT